LLISDTYKIIEIFMSIKMR